MSRPMPQYAPPAPGFATAFTYRVAIIRLGASAPHLVGEKRVGAPLGEPAPAFDPPFKVAAVAMGRSADRVVIGVHVGWPNRDFADEEKSFLAELGLFAIVFGFFGSFVTAEDPNFTVDDMVDGLTALILDAFPDGPAFFDSVGDPINVNIPADPLRRMRDFSLFAANGLKAAQAVNTEVGTQGVASGVIELMPNLGGSFFFGP